MRWRQHAVYLMVLLNLASCALALPESIIYPDLYLAKEPWDRYPDIATHLLEDARSCE